MFPVRKENKRRETDPSKLRPSGVVLNRKDLHDFKQLSTQYKDCESLYLRENEFTEFSPYITLERLKILDLSMNMIRGTVDFLTKLPNIHHLYMTSNSIESLTGFDGLVGLESLCLSDNLITSFEGLDRLPNLRLLSLNYNQISSFSMFPYLPQLHTLNLVGNPIVQTPSYRQMAIALTTQALHAIDGKPVEEEERTAVASYKGKVVFCLSEGFIIEGDNVNEAADKFLLEFERDLCKDKPLSLQSISLTTESGGTTLSEGNLVKFNVCLQDTRDYKNSTSDMFFSRYFFPVSFRIAGDATEVFLVGSMNNWTEQIHLERIEGEEEEVFFHAILYLAAGDYEYRYIVDGQEKLSDENKAPSQTQPGSECNVYHVMQPVDADSDSETILYIRWMRSDENNGYNIIDCENSALYTPTARDIGTCLRAEVLVYINGEFSFQYFDISTPIVSGPPRCQKLEIVGNPTEGEVLVANALSSGGTQENSTLAWFRVTPEGDQMLIEFPDPWKGYQLTLEDVGHRIKVEFTPVRDDWTSGEPVSEVSEVVAAGVPTCSHIEIFGDPMEGKELTVETEYKGGVEGCSIYQWFRHDDANDEYIPILGAYTNVFKPLQVDVDRRIAVEYTPISRDGIEGNTIRCEMKVSIEPGAPEIRHLEINGECQEGGVLGLDMDYAGGHFGQHKYQWFKKDAAGRASKIPHAVQQTYTIIKQDIGFVIEIRVTPVRSDGAIGNKVTAATTQTILPHMPSVKSLTINETMGGKDALTLELQVEYMGGEEGESIIEWARTSKDSVGYELVAKQVHKYHCQKEDAGHILKVSYTPIRSDGVQGNTIFRLVEVPTAEGDAANKAPEEHLQEPILAEQNEKDEKQQLQEQEKQLQQLVAEETEGKPVEEAATVDVEKEE